jgi:hypothetical protein
MQEAGAGGLAARTLPDAPGAATPSPLAGFRSGRPTKRTRLSCNCVVYEVAWCSVRRNKIPYTIQEVTEY